MVELARMVNASGWAFDLEAKGIPLESYAAFFVKLRTAFAPAGLKVQYTSGHHFVNSNNYSVLLPLVDYVFDMTCYSHCGVSQRPAQVHPSAYSPLARHCAVDSDATLPHRPRLSDAVRNGADR
jgi:hypothetical protein